MTTQNNTAGLSILAAIGRGEALAKAAKPAKTAKAKTAPKKAKPVKAAKAAPAPKAPKAAKPVKAPKEKKVTETVTAAPVFDAAALLAEYHASDVRDDAYILSLIQKAFDAGKEAPRARAPRAGGPTKRDLAAALLRRPEGCTSKDILDATNWPAVSVPAIAKASGLSLRQVKEGRVTTYFGS